MYIYVTGVYNKPVQSNSPHINHYNIDMKWVYIKQYIGKFSCVLCLEGLK